ncbi:glycoside hydrolase family 3 C-terminal domain-containing protein [Loktanella sp. TSTF-M6]|uniref:Glycoside hydrolase family 3 C-terminal domain-containing protein n=1 Tax=Loktanella gaetbuli TaxID=2881335 RepID=A0ABS8BR47_9RHOB|nr:glycoside hydrolase family 3 C-terminal domain-containing protein [Loktanella gaetbuli]MCB5198214.1 glycoside hydrolase family 3 C-terminal domain-containing protein [Loktanella gaetbuli]
MTDHFDTLLDQMTLAEQVQLLSGADFWSVNAPDRLGLGTLRVTDGPNGARGGGSLVGGVTAAAFPVGIALGATWDPDLAHEIGTALAAEVKSKGAHMLLAPTVNLHRSVTNGRNFECYAEDPELTAALTVGYIRGLQSQGIAATIKHFAGNESEIERTTINSDVDERSLRELYLRPFEAAVKDAGTWGIMSSYNKLNGTYTAENAWLLTKVLRDEWGYDGIVMSDWFGSRSTKPTMDAGLDLEMPGPTRDRGDTLVQAVEAGAVDAATVRRAARNMLVLMDRTGALRDLRPHHEVADDRPATRALIRRAGAAATVLLQNDGILPLAPQGTLAVIGPNAKTARIMGGGSAQLNPHYSVAPWDALLDRMGGDALTYAPGCTNHRWEPLLTGDFEVAYRPKDQPDADPVHTTTTNGAEMFIIPPIGDGTLSPSDVQVTLTGTYTPTDSGTHRVGITATGPCAVYLDDALIVDGRDWQKGRTFFEEGCDEVVGTIDLTAGQTYAVRITVTARSGDNLQFTALRAGIGKPMGDAEIAAAATAAAQADRAVVFVGRSGEWDTEGSDLEDITLPGRQDDLIAAVAAANPNTVVVLQTGGPVEMPWAGDVAAILQAWYPGQEAGHAVADVLFGDAEPGGRLPQTFPAKWSDNPTQSQDRQVYPGLDGTVRYAEGLLIGYRHYDRHGITPLFPFGHGLSYTQFALSDLSVTANDTGASVTLTVTNTGDRTGTTVAQIYVSEDAPQVPRPDKELEGFAKLSLDAGEARTVTIPLDHRAFAYWDQDTQGWRVDAGTFTIHAGLSATDLQAHAQIALENWTGAA